MHRPCVIPCSPICPRLTGPASGPVLATCLSARMQLPAIRRCLHTDTYSSHNIRASLWAVTDGGVPIGALHFPRLCWIHTDRQKLPLTTRAVCFAAALLRLCFGNRASQIDFRVFFPSPPLWLLSAIHMEW